MVEQRKKQKTKRRDKNRGAVHEVTKEEYAVAKYARFNCPTKTATIMGNEMHYFTASKAIDCLIGSKKWGQNADEKTRLFPNRQTCVVYMQTLLDKGLLFRAKKLVPKRKDRDAVGTEAAATGAASSSTDKTTALLRKDSKGTKNAADEKESAQQKSAAAKKLASPKAKKSALAAESSAAALAHSSESNDKNATKEKEKEKDGKKKSKKIKFEVHQIQEFNDSNDIYVWKYDPTSTKMFFLGLAMVLGSIGVCLFPLWPKEVRSGVYHLSVAAMGFVGFIVVLVILRCILFGVIWCVTWGKHHFWLLPHLTDDCGFFDSFKPLYSHTVVDKTTGSDSGSGTDKTDSATAGTGKDDSAAVAGTGKDGGGGIADADDDDEDDDDNSGAEQDDKNSDDENGNENADDCKNSNFSPSESEQLLTDEDEEEEDGSNPAESDRDTAAAAVPQKDKLKRKKDQ